MRELQHTASRGAWLVLPRDGSTATVRCGISATIDSPGVCPRGWFWDTKTLILGATEEQEPAPTEAEWTFPTRADIIERVTRAIIVFACRRQFAGLHSPILGFGATILINSEEIEMVRIQDIDKPRGHGDYFLTMEVPEYIRIPELTAYERIYAWSFRTELLRATSQTVSVRLHEPVKWDIDYVALFLQLDDKEKYGVALGEIPGLLDADKATDFVQHERSHYELLLELWHRFSVPDLHNHEKGRLFEEFVASLFSSTFCVRKQNLYTKRGELDLLLEISKVEPFWMDFGGAALVECKNWKSKRPVGDVSHFTNKVRQTHIKLGFFVSVSGFTESARASLLSTSSDPTGPLIVPITGQQIREALERNADLEEFFKERIRDIKYQSW